MLLTREQKWGAIGAIGWGTKTTDYEQAAKDLRSILSEDEFKELEDFCYTMVDQVHRALHHNWLSGNLKGQPWLGDDSFHDLCCHIVGMGYKTFEQVITTKQPPYALEAEENFMYIFNPIEKDVKE